LDLGIDPPLLAREPSEPFSGMRQRRTRVAAMRLVTYLSEGDERAGVQGADGVIDAAAVLGTERIGVRELIAGARLEELGEAVGATDAEPISRPELLPPLPDPTRSSASASTTARMPRRPGSTRPSSPPSSPSSATRWRRRTPP